MSNVYDHINHTLVKFIKILNSFHVDFTLTLTANALVSGYGCLT